MKHSISLKIIAIIAPVIPVLIAFFVLLQSTQQHSERLRHWINRAYEVTNQINSLLADLLDAEAGQRGFILTGDEFFLEQYEKGMAKMDGHLRNLRSLVHDNPIQQLRLDRLEPLMEAKTANLQQTIAMRRTENLQTVSAVIANRIGKNLMDGIRHILDAMTHEETVLLELRKAEFREATVMLHRVEVVIIVALALMYLIMTWLLIRSTIRPLRALTLGARALTAGDYDARIELDSRDEFGTLAQAFNRMAEAVQKRKQEIEDNENRLHTIIETSLEGIITINNRGIVESINPMAVRLFGYQAREIIGQNIKMLMPEPYYSEHDSYLKHYRETGEKKIIGTGREVRGKRKDGSIFHMELAVSEMRINGQQMFSGLVRDVTERKLAESELKEFGQRLALATQSAGIGVWDYDLVSGSLNWDARMYELYGIAEETFPGAYEAWSTALHPDDRERAETELNRAVSGDQEFDTSFRILWPDGSEHTIKAAAIVIRDAADQATRMIGVNWDITEQNRIATMKNEFISTVSHELRTPLTSIQGALELILSGSLGAVPDDCAPLLTIANNNSARLVRLINDILDIEKIESGKMAFNVMPLDIMTVIEESIEANSAYGNEFGVTYTITARVSDCFVLADHDRLMQVMTNLLSNAAKFSPSGGTVEIGALTQDNTARISVTDHGPGIPDAFKPRIFNKFSQADASSTRQQGGTGLGLSICKSIIEKLGGKIDYASRPHSETTFYFELPVYSQQTLPASLTTLSTSDPILVCEDDPDVANLLKFMLEENGHRVDIALNAETAKQKLHSQRYAALTLDLLLPGKNGIDLFRELRQTEGLSDLPVIVISAIADKGRKELNGDAISVYDWMNKPIDQDRLESAISRILEDKAKTHFHILHVEDDPDIVTLVNALLKNRATIDVAEDLKTAAIRLEQRYDLVILDLMLPDGAGSSLLPNLARHTPPVPVLVFSALDKSQELKDRVNASLVKSKTSNDELVRTIESILRQPSNPSRK